jgi:uncharacterized PurR-regulated membrane protein YhhQ (DUF165 family)
MLRWRKVLQYAVALFAALFLTGLFEGLLQPEKSAGLLTTQVASSVVSLLVCTAVFTHLAVHQADRTLEHALLALLAQLVIGLLTFLLAPLWLRTACASFEAQQSTRGAPKRGLTPRSTPDPLRQAL